VNANGDIKENGSDSASPLTRGRDSTYRDTAEMESPITQHRRVPNSSFANNTQAISGTSTGDISRRNTHQGFPSCSTVTLPERDPQALPSFC